jgi:hypothetical protein
MLYSFTLDTFVKVNDSIEQTGIKKVVSNIINKANPSIPKTILLFVIAIQFISSTNWKLELVLSKLKTKKIEILKISKDQNKEKLRINKIFLLLIKKSKNEPNNGNKIRVDSILNILIFYVLLDLNQY